MGVRKKITYEVNEAGCFICTSHARGTHGYPQLWKNGTNHNIHRVIYEEFHGISISKEIVVRHTCDRRDCINPEHLIEGSPKQNTWDMVERNRHKYQFGENHTDAKLTNTMVLEILEADGPQYAIAELFGVNQSTVSRIKNAKRRKDILCK